MHSVGLSDGSHGHQTVIYMAMGPAGLKTKNHLTGEGQQHFSELDKKLQCNKDSAYTERRTPSVRRRRGSISKHVHV
jgi:hypothetical protein